MKQIASEPGVRGYRKILGNTGGAQRSQPLLSAARLMAVFSPITRRWWRGGGDGEVWWGGSGAWWWRSDRSVGEKHFGLGRKTRRKTFPAAAVVAGIRPVVVAGKEREWSAYDDDDGNGGGGWCGGGAWCWGSDRSVDGEAFGTWSENSPEKFSGGSDGGGGRNPAGGGCRKREREWSGPEVTRMDRNLSLPTSRPLQGPTTATITTITITYGDGIPRMMTFRGTLSQNKVQRWEELTGELMQ
ncbi:hypothetical protein Tco_1458684 [Tanacetum coccineum]